MGNKERAAEKAAMEREILKMCRGKFLSAAAMAERVGLSVNTVRAHYVYPLVKEGALEQKYPHRRAGQAYKTTKS